MNSELFSNTQNKPVEELRMNLTDGNVEFNVSVHTIDISLDTVIIEGYVFGISLEVGAMERASVFKSNKSQAVRLPKPVALPDSVKKVDIIPLGRGRLIVPAGEAWDSWFDGKGVTDDFMDEREQPLEQDRQSL